MPGSRSGRANGVTPCEDLISRWPISARWPSGPTLPVNRRQEFVSAILGCILNEPETLIVLESTANGAGNYFHREWLRSCRGESDKEPVFVPWYEIELHRAEVSDYKALWESLDEYERRLWDIHGCTLEQIQWYRSMLVAHGSKEKMAAEYPTDDIEAFGQYRPGRVLPRPYRRAARRVVSNRS